VEPEETAVARQRLGKHVSEARDTRDRTVQRGVLRPVRVVSQFFIYISRLKEQLKDAFFSYSFEISILYFARIHLYANEAGRFRQESDTKR
jgi:hypothetical protein